MFTSLKALVGVCPGITQRREIPRPTSKSELGKCPEVLPLLTHALFMTSCQVPSGNPHATDVERGVHEWKEAEQL